MTKARTYYDRLNASLGDADSPFIEDRLFWLSTPEAECAETIEAIDQRGDTQPFLDYLKQYVPEEAYEHIENLFQRKRLVNKNTGRPPAPSYDATPADKALLTGLVTVRSYID